MIYGEIKVDIGKILRQLCQQKGIEIIEAQLCTDHVHMLISIPPKYSVSQIMGYLKGKSSLMIFDRHANLKYKYGACGCTAGGWRFKGYDGHSQFGSGIRGGKEDQRRQVFGKPAEPC